MSSLQRILVCQIGGKPFGFLLSSTREIEAVQKMTPLPQLNHFAALFNLRGEIIPVFRASQILGLPDQPDGPRSRVVIVDWQDRADSPEERVGMIVDQVIGFEDLRADQRLPVVTVEGPRMEIPTPELLSFLMPARIDNKPIVLGVLAMEAFLRYAQTQLGVSS